MQDLLGLSLYGIELAHRPARAVDHRLGVGSDVAHGLPFVREDRDRQGAF